MPDRAQDHYRILGVDPGATQTQIKRAYRRRALRTHPDAGGDREAFARVKRAYDILGDPRRRRRYDIRAGVRPPGTSSSGSASGAGFGALFSGLLGGLRSVAADPPSFAPRDEDARRAG
jgi:molecular chaperone DnaJ